MLNCSLQNWQPNYVGNVFKRKVKVLFEWTFNISVFSFHGLLLMFLSDFASYEGLKETNAFWMVPTALEKGLRFFFEEQPLCLTQGSVQS